MTTSIIAPASLNWPTMKDSSIGTEMSYKSIKNVPLRPEGMGFNSQGGLIRWREIGFTGRVSATPRYAPEVPFIIGNVAGTTPAAMFQNLNGKIGLAHLGVNRMIEEAEVSLNGGAAIKSDVRAHIDLFAQSCSPEDLAMISPLSAPDEYCYFDATRANNPLRSGGDAPDILTTRGAGGRYEASLVCNPATHEATFTVKPSSMIMAPPFQFRTPSSATPFVELRQFTLSLKIVDIIKNLLNLDHTPVAPPAAAGDPATSDGGIGRHNRATELTVRLGECKHEIFMESYEESELVDPPHDVVYNCPEITVLDTVHLGGTVAPGAEAVFRGNAIKVMGGVPTRLAYVAPVPVNPGVPWGEPIRHLALARRELDVNNSRSLRRGTDITELYRENVKAGYNGSFATFAGQLANLGGDENHGAGGIPFENLASLPLGSFVVPNSEEEINTSTEVVFRNQMRETLNGLHMDIVAISDRFLIYKDGVYEEFKPLVSKEDIVKAKVVFEDDAAARHSVKGGSWMDMWSAFKRFINGRSARTTVRTLRNLPVASRYVGDRTMLGHMAKSVGYGKSGGAAKRVGGKATKVGGKASKVGGSLRRTGGARASGADLDAFLTT